MVIIACVLQNSQYPIYIVIVVVNLYTIFSYIQSANIGYLFGCIWNPVWNPGRNLGWNPGRNLGRNPGRNSVFLCNAKL